MQTVENCKRRTTSSDTMHRVLFVVSHLPGARHVTTLERDESSGDFLTMHVYSGTKGKRVYYPDNPMFRGIYTNNPHTLIR